MHKKNTKQFCEDSSLNQYDLSIIIVSYNTCSVLVKCLDSIYQFSENLSIQIIISDNASSDETVKTIRKRFSEVYILENKKNLGFGSANNRAINYCKGRFVLFMNPDMILIEPVLKKVIDFLERNKDAGLVGCKLVNPDGNVQKSFIRAFPTLTNRFLEAIYVEKLFDKLSRHNKNKNGTRKVAAIVGACIFARKNLIEELGGFDESYFMYCEDIDLCLRVQKKGYNIYYLENVAMLHYLGVSTEKNTKIYFEKVLTKESVYKYFIKYHGQLQAELYRFLMIVGGVIRLVVLFILLPFSNALKINYNHSILKYTRVVSWGLGFEKWTKNPG